jgi:O-antigen/teichoic acid export membrane protein
MGSVYANLLISSVFSIYIFYNLLKISSFEFSFKYVKYSLKFGIPLLPAMLSSFILASFDIIIINQLEGSTNTGLYSFAYNIGMLMEMLILATANSWQPIFYEEFGNKNYLKLDRMAYNYSKYIYLSAVLLILFSKELVMILADKSYHVALNLVPIIVLGYLCFYLYTLYGHYTTYRKKTYLSSLYTMVAGIINIGLNYLLIPKFGYYIAAYTTFISYFVLFLLYYLNAKFILKDHVISLGKIFPNFLIVLLIGIIYVVITNYVNLYLIVLLVKLIITACSIYYFLFRKNLYYVGGRNQILF